MKPAALSVRVLVDAVAQRARVFIGSGHLIASVALPSSRRVEQPVTRPTTAERKTR